MNSKDKHTVEEVAVSETSPIPKYHTAPRIFTLSLGLTSGKFVRPGLSSNCPFHSICLNVLIDRIKGGGEEKKRKKEKRRVPR